MTMKEHALEYARQGIMVFPVHSPENGKCSCGHDDCTNPAKHPRTRNGFYDATTDDLQITTWWDMWPDANIGALTENFLVLDCDSEEANFFAQTQGISATFSVERGTHRHYFFTQTDPPTSRMTGKSSIFEHLDILGVGGYVIMAPSVHISGDKYTASCPFVFEDLADFPRWAMDMVREKRQNKAKSSRSTNQNDATERINSGGRNTALASAAGSMRKAGFDYDAILAALLEFNRKRCDPPLSDAEVMMIAKSIAKYETPDMAGFTASVAGEAMESGDLGARTRDGLIFPGMTHGSASDCLSEMFQGRMVFNKTVSNGIGDFFIKPRGAAYWEPCEGIRDKCRIGLERVIEKEYAVLQKHAPDDEEYQEALRDAYGKSIAKARTAPFINAMLLLLGERLQVPKIMWNSSPNAIPCLDKIIDFSASYPVARDPALGEFFRNPVPCKADAILNCGDAFAFESFMKNLFHDDGTRETALQCLSLCISGVPSKTAQIWNNIGGDGGKNTLFDMMSQLIPGRVVMVKSSVITVRGDASERRFGEAECEGRGGVFFDELSAEIDINQIKKLTGLSEITAERKGKDPFTFRQTWALVMLCNRLPRFRPADDSAFLSRLLVLPFSSVFYSNDDIKAIKLKSGVEESKLKPAQDKLKLLDSLMAERPAIIRTLIAAWIRCRDGYGGIPFKSKEVREAGEKYRIQNDDIERFFDDMLERGESHERMNYDEIKTAWKDFTGNDRFDNVRWLISELTGKFAFIEKSNSNGIRVLKGIRRKIESTEKKSECSDFPDDDQVREHFGAAR